MNLRPVARHLIATTPGRRVKVILAALLALVLVVSFAPSALSASFSDVPSTHPYSAAIADLSARGILGGYASGDFGPNDLVVRQQFAKMIAKTAGYTINGTEICPFTDVAAQVGSDPFYPSKYVAVCASHGITTGETPTTFDPTGYITRYQAVTMVVRMADDLQPGLLVTPPSAPPSTWSADSRWTSNPTHGPNAARAEYNELLVGLDLTSLDPYGKVSRGEVAQMLHNCLVRLATTATTSATVPNGSLVQPYYEVVQARSRVRALVSPAGAVIRWFAAYNELNAVTTMLTVSPTSSRGEAGWYQVLLPCRPNGSKGWVAASEVSVSLVDTAIVLRLAAHRLTLYKQGREAATYPVCIGTATNPTPTGVFFVTGVTRTDPSGPYGPYAIGTSALSDTLTDWPGGGVVGIHGTNNPSSVGRSVSHGCIRLTNHDIRELAQAISLGTPIFIQP